MPPSIFEQVRAIASDIFSIPAINIKAESSPETIESWDSMQHLNLVLALEEKFNLQLSPEDIDEMKSVGKISNLLSTRLQSTRS